MSYDHISRSVSERDRHENYSCGLRVLTIAIALAVLAILINIGPVAGLYSTFLLMAAAIRGIAAANAKEPLRGRHLGLWDETAMLLALAMAVDLVGTIIGS